MQVVWTIIAIIATLVGVVFTAMLSVFLVMSLGNASPSERAWKYAGLAALLISGLLSAGIAIALMVHGRPLLAAAVGAVPVGTFIGIYVYETLSP